MKHLIWYVLVVLFVLGLATKIIHDMIVEKPSHTPVFVGKVYGCELYKVYESGDWRYFARCKQ